MPHVLDPQVAGELGDATRLDTSTHPPRVLELEFMLDLLHPDDLVQTFPVHLVSEDLAGRLHDLGLSGFRLVPTEVRASEERRDLVGDVPCGRFQWLQVTGTSGVDDCWLDDTGRLVVTDRMLAVLRDGRLTDCRVDAI